MWGLEYALLFGVPNNKLELIRGRSRCAFPFRNRDEAEAHFAAWIETLCRWKGVEKPSIRKGRRRWKAEAAGSALELYPLPIELRVSLDSEAFRTFKSSCWRRDLWGGQPEGHETGWEDSQRHHDVRLNLWSLFRRVCEDYGGLHSGRVDVVLSETASVNPDQCYFRADPEQCLIAGQYFRGAPDLIAEVLSPATRQTDRGPRKELYRRAGVRHLWLLDPELEILEVYELDGTDYRLAATARPGDEFQPVLFPKVRVAVAELFDTQWKRHRDNFSSAEPEAVPEWLVAPEKRLGLEYLLLLGHPEMRCEIWGNRAPCVLAFGSSAEARLRFGHFLEDAARWEQIPKPRPSTPEPDAEQAEVGRFRLTRRGRHVHLEVAVDGRQYTEMLRVWADEGVWDWGEEKR